MQGALKGLERIQRPSAVDSTFEEQNRQILTLVFRHGTRMSEIEVARGLGRPRQPVHDAVNRLSKPGFLTIRPPRATTVSLISERPVLRALFVRTAIELKTVRAACERLDTRDHAAPEVIDGSGIYLTVPGLLPSASNGAIAAMIAPHGCRDWAAGIARRPGQRRRAA